MFAPLKTTTGIMVAIIFLLVHGIDPAKATNTAALTSKTDKTALPSILETEYKKSRRGLFKRKKRPIGNRLRRF